MSWIQTYSGGKFDFLNPTPESVSVLDIAEALSKQCRYNGHCVPFYSVAEHSVRGAEWMFDERNWAVLDSGCHRGGDCVRTYARSESGLSSQDLAFYFLVHDAVEAYVGDLPAPLKSLVPQFVAVEAKVEAVIMGKFGLPVGKPAEVHEVDMRMAVTEKQQLLVSSGVKWALEDKYPPLPIKIEPWSPEKAKQEFLKAFALMGPSVF